MPGRFRNVRTWLWGLVIAAVAVAGCGGGASGNQAGQSTQKVKLVYFNARAADPVEQALVKRYMQDHPNVTIEYLATTAMPGPSDTDAIANLIFNIQAKTTVDVAKVEISRTPLDLMAARSIQDLAQIGGDAVNQQLKGLLNTNYVSFDRGVWALPYEYDPFGYVYNASLFQAAGISSPPKTWDDMRRVNRTILQKFPGTWPICHPIQNLSKMQPYVWSAGGTYWDRDLLPKRADFQNPGIVAAYSFAQEWAQSNWTNTSDITSTNSIQWMISRKCAAMDYSAALAVTLRVNDPSQDWRVAATPVKDASFKATNFAGGSALVVPSTSKYPRAALDFILWLTSREGQSLKYGVDNSLGLAKQDVFNEATPSSRDVGSRLTGNPDWKQALATSGVPTRPSGVSPAYSRAYQLLADMQQRILLKRSSVDQELGSTQGAVQQLIDDSMQKNPELYRSR
ncbi:MAG TPA: extracellular solute-binding protein [Candidatus Dormibacteraeota bacterium]